MHDVWRGRGVGGEGGRSDKLGGKSHHKLCPPWCVCCLDSADVHGAARGNLRDGVLCGESKD